MAQTTKDYIFTSILKRAAQERIVPDKSKTSKEWFREKASKYKNINRNDLFANAVTTSKPIPGKMYMYVYDAKTKEKLPYWDAFPLIFCVNISANGYDGINLHYLPPVLRARLMDALYTTINNDKMNQTTKLRISYNILQSASTMKLFKPCYKKYLFSQLKSRLIEVPASEWDIALFLPTQNFQKASAETVWADSSKFDGYKFKKQQIRSKFKSRLPKLT